MREYDRERERERKYDRCVLGRENMIDVRERDHDRWVRERMYDRCERVC